MATEKKKQENRYRNIFFMLYPDNPDHAKALEELSLENCAYILHDKDVWTKEDEIENPNHKEGEPKKEHYHVLVKYANGVGVAAQAKKYGLEERWLEGVTNFDKALLYLIHYEDKVKYQYDIEEVGGPLAKRLSELVNKMEKTEGEKVYELLQFLENCGSRITVTQFAKYCATNGYWAEFRRSGAIFCKILEEHNQEIMMLEQKHLDKIE